MRAVRMSILSIVCAAAAPGVASASAARAAGPPPPSAIAQYIEAVPTSSGDSVPGTPNAHGAVQPQSPSPQVARTIRRQGGSDAAALTRIVSNPEYGAPTHAPPRDSTVRVPALPAIRDPSVLAAAFSGGSSHDAALFLGSLALITCAAVSTALLRRQ